MNAKFGTLLAVLIMLLATASVCTAAGEINDRVKSQPVKAEKLYPERYRPQFHFSPAKNWTNDPNGMAAYFFAFAAGTTLGVSSALPHSAQLAW